MAKNKPKPTDPPAPADAPAGVVVLPPEPAAGPEPAGGPEPPAASPESAPPPKSGPGSPQAKAFAFEVHNPMVGWTHGTVHAATEDDAREQVRRWLTAGLSLREA